MALNDLNDLIGPIAERIVTTYSDRPDALIESFRRRDMPPENIQQLLNLGLAQRITDRWNERNPKPPGSLDQMLNAINFYSRPIPPIGNGGRSRRRKSKSRRRKSRR
jgi:hypothetical protein